LEKHAVSIFRAEVTKLRSGGLIWGFRKEVSLREGGQSRNMGRRVQTNRKSLSRFREGAG
jgi:hypothetical protein